jgi:hypothetical protein
MEFITESAHFSKAEYCVGFYDLSILCLCVSEMRSASVEPGNAQYALPDLPIAEVCQPFHVCFAFARVKRVERHLR